MNPVDAFFAGYFVGITVMWLAGLLFGFLFIGRLRGTGDK